MGPILGGVARLKLDSTANIVCEGDSLTNGFGSGTSYPTQLAALLGGTVPVTNIGISGQTLLDMLNNSSDVEAAWAAGKSNILNLMGGTNDITFGASAATAMQRATNYIAARRASKVWKKIVIFTIPPRQNGGSDAQHAVLNATIDAYNALIRANFKAMGADAMLDIRQAGGPWSAANFPDYTTATFNASVAQGWWENNPGGYTHFSTAGYGAIAAMDFAVVKRLPAR